MLYKGFCRASLQQKGSVLAQPCGEERRGLRSAFAAEDPQR
jgi:hypothetical protein